MTCAFVQPISRVHNAERAMAILRACYDDFNYAPSARQMPFAKKSRKVI